MNRHPFRWDALVFGLFFLAVLGEWAVWEQNLLDQADLAFTAAAALIVLGVVGILATVVSARSSRQAPFTPERDQPVPDEPVPAQPGPDQLGLDHQTDVESSTPGGNQ